jgi:hypothetical protein
MPQIQKLMTLDEKLAIGVKAHEALFAGDKEGCLRIAAQAPMPAHLVKILKDKMGADYIRQFDWNFAEAEAEFGPGWLDK